MNKLVDWITSRLLRWDRFRVALFAEVDWHNSITRIINDPEDMKIATAMWCEDDGWRGWNKREDRYYFHDIPEKSLGDLMDILLDREEAYA